MKINVIAEVLYIISDTMNMQKIWHIIHIYRINLIDMRTRKLGNYLLIKYIKKKLLYY